MRKSVTLIIFMILCGFARAQEMSVEQYIDTYKGLAISEMKRTGIPASVTLAQGILETENGNSDLVKRSNNHFGLKCKSTWTGDTVAHTDDLPDECFRKYDKAEDSYRDHSDYLRATPRYASLFTLDPEDYKGWAYGLKKAGYATNPRYPQILIGNIEKYDLQQYDSTGNFKLSDVAGIEPSNVPRKRFKLSDVVGIEPSKNRETKMKPAASDKEATAGPAIELKPNTRFNNIKAYFAVKGTSLLAIATTADIPLDKLLDYNDLVDDGITKENCWVYLEKKPKSGNRDIYTSLQNETLYDIAQNNGVQLKSLEDLNNLPPDAAVKKGAIIKLR